MVGMAVRRFEVSAHLVAEGRFFAQQMGWPIRIDVAHGRLVLCTGDVVDALRLPSTLAEPVVLGLSTALLVGPVCTDGRWWTVLTAPCHRKVELAPELRAARVHAVPRDGQIIIPPVAGESWWQPPDPGRPLPPWSAVVSMARRVINRPRSLL